MILFFRSVMKRSMISATAMIEAISNGQIGQPAAWMISNNGFPSHDYGRHFSLRRSFEQGRCGLAGVLPAGCRTMAGPITMDALATASGVHASRIATGTALIHISCG